MLEKENILINKSYKFALRIINLNKFLNDNHHIYQLSKQILRSGTSIGANVEEAIGAASRKDFINKIFIGHKEARETSYWLRLLHDSGYIDKKMFDSIISDCDDLIKISGKIISTSKKNI